MIRNYVVVAFRNLKKNSLFTFINIAGLSIGFACCLLIFMYANNEWSYDSFHSNAGCIFRISTLQNNNGKRDAIATTSSPLAATLQTDIPGIKTTTRIGKWHGNFKVNNTVFEEGNVYAADPSFFSLFSFPLVLGRAALDNDNAIVLTENTAARYFGNDWKTKNIIGKTISAKAGAAEYLFTVQGVVKNIPVNSSLQFDLLLPFHLLETFDNSQNEWNYSSYYTFVQTDGKLSLPQLQASIKNQYSKYVANSSTQLQVQPLQDMYLHSSFAFDSDFFIAGNTTYIGICLAIGGLILLLSCINFINLTTARSARRAKEIGMRKTVGASRQQLIVQFMAEAAVLCAVALLLALCLVQLFLPLFQTLCGKALQPHFDTNFYIVLFIFYSVVVLLSGFYPALFLSSFSAMQAIKGVWVTSSKTRFREAMMLFQFVVSVVMMICAIAIAQQLKYIQDKDVGFTASELLYIRLKNPEAKKNYRALQQEIERQSGVNSVSAATANLVDVSNGGDVQWQGMNSKDALSITQITADENFMAVTGMRLAAGRNFSAQYASDTTAFIINQTAAERMNFGKDALNKTITFWGITGKVIGVVKDFNYQPLTTSVQPLLLRYRPGEWHFDLLIRTKPGSIGSALSAIQKIYKKYDPDAMFEYGFVDQQLNKLYAEQQRTSRIINCFALLAIIISCLGLLGLVTYVAEQRTKEIGIRKILGANLAALFALLSREFAWLVGVSIVIAIPIGYLLTHYWLQTFVYRIEISWQVFALAGAMAILLAFITIFFQTIKAAVANPVKSLRTE